MATIQENVTRSDDVTEQLSRLRQLIRYYVVALGVAAALIVMAVAFWISLLIDWTFELSLSGRGIVLAVAALALIAVLYRVVFSRFLVPLTDRNMAMLLERRHLILGDRLVTVVELEGRPAQRDGFDSQMLAQTRNEVDELMRRTSATSVFNVRPLIVYSVLAVALAGSVLGFAAWQHEATRIWVDRSLMLGDAAWPRATRIMVEDFPEDEQGRRVVKVAAGSRLAVRAKADLNWATPQFVEVEYEAEKGVARRPKMTKLKDAVRGRDTHQFYEYKFINIQTTTVFSVSASADGLLSKRDRVENLVIQAVESPDLTDIQLECQYPDYLGKSSETFSVRLIRPLPEGTQVRIIARANKDLREAAFRETLQNPESSFQPISMDPAEPRSVNVDLGPLRADARIGFQLLDRDNVVNQQPIRLLLRVTPDEQPRVEIELAGIGKAVTPFADLPITGTVSDDHKITQTWFEFSVDGGVASTLEFPTPDDGRFDEEADVVFQMAELATQPGQRVSLSVKAADNYALESLPNIGASDRYDLRIVSEGQLRALLEKRERILRRRFEGIITEMNRTHDSLERMAFGLDQQARSADPATDGARGQDVLAAPIHDASTRLESVRLLRAETALETSDRMANETTEVATEFDRILLELELNNVTFIDELRRRLGEGIVLPLKNIVAQQFPKLDDRLGQLRQMIKDDETRPAAIAASLRQLDVVLMEMDHILKNMLELQKFNELLADLRKIIDHQEQVSQSTERERKEIERRRKEELKKGLLD